MLKNFITGIRTFFKTMGLVEQSQVVASTAVVVAMITIVVTHIALGENLTSLDFISVVTVGVFGYVTVFFSLKYGRMLEEQRRELHELNTIAEAVNHSVELTPVLQSALIKVMELMHADSGWIYLQENSTFVLKHQYGTDAPLFPPSSPVNDDAYLWVRSPGVLRTDDPNILYGTTNEFKEEGMKILVSIPLVRQASFAGALIIGSKELRKFEAKKIAVIQAFGNQISVALNNASLFEQVRRSEQLYADLYEHSPDMYHSVDRNGIVISCNLTESEMLGLAKEEIVGKPLLRLYPPSEHKHVDMNLKKIFGLGQVLKGIEEQIRRRDGTTIDVSVNTSLIRDTDGRPVIVRMVLRDITEKKKMEAKILQAQKIDSIGNLAGGIAHDFNNILTAILGSASIMRRRLADDRCKKYVDLIETTSRRGAAVTRQLLTFARKNNPHVGRVDANTVIEQTIRLFEVTAPKSIHIKWELPSEPMIVEADETQLQQAVLNLFLNARDAMPEGGILVVRCQEVLTDEGSAQQLTDGEVGSFVTITVTDSGQGIPSNILSRIFEPFFTTKEQGKGTGLGLSVVYGVVKSHNGHLNVRSEVNSGTEFTIYLPRIFDRGLTAMVHPDSSEPTGGTERILLVEDEISVGEIGADILRDLGYQIELAQNGREAIDILVADSQAFHLVILDMNMPRMGGRATFDQIKKLFPALKVLVCSGYSATMLDDGTFAEAIDGFIQKPYELADFARKIRTILDSRAGVPSLHR